MKRFWRFYQYAILFLGALLLGEGYVCGQDKYHEDYRLQKVQNKNVDGEIQNKWYQMRENISQKAKDLDTFSDEDWSFTNPYTGNEMQAAHTWVDTIYVKKGTTCTLMLPTTKGGANNSAQLYQRWYNFRTEGVFRTNQSGNRQRWDLLTPQGNVNVFRFSNGYVAGADHDGNKYLISTGSWNGTKSGIMYSADFYYPTDLESVIWNIDNGDAGNTQYLVACDLSGYTDFTHRFTVSSKRSSFMDDFIEPTLSLRAIYYIIGVEDDMLTSSGVGNTPEWFQEGYGRLARSEYQGGNGRGKKFLEEYDITFPADHISNHTDEVLALTKAAGNHGGGNLTVNIVSSATSADISLVSGNSLASSVTLSGTDRVISFRKSRAAKGSRWSVNDGDTATIIVTKGTYPRYNIAKYKLRFKKETRLLTQHQLERIDNREAAIEGTDWNQPYRTPRYLRENYQLLTSRTFDYDPQVPGMVDVQEYYYPYPLQWGYSSYAFFDGSRKVSNTVTDFQGWTMDLGGFYANQPFVEWGSYCIANEFVGYDDATNSRRFTEKTLGGRGEADDASEYFLYVDASDLPGTIVTLPFTENLCPGTELFVTAWVKSGGADDQTDAAMLFTINGIRADGTKKTLHSQSTGQIRNTAYNGSDNGRGDYTSANGYGTGTNDWYQLYFSFINDDVSNADFVSYEVRIDNNCSNTTGGDFYLDDIEVFISRPTARVEQLEYTCVNERTPLNVSLNWIQLCERLGIDEENPDLGMQSEGIDFCFIDTVKYAEGLRNALSRQDSINALDAAIENVGGGDEAGGYDQPIVSLFFYLDWERNDSYPKHTINPDGTKKYNIAYFHKKEDGNFYFYGAGAKETDDRRLTIDFYANLSPNHPYQMLIIDRDPNKGAATVADFHDMMDDPCGIKTLFYVTSQTMVKVNGEVLDPQTDFCEGQVFNFGAQIRVPTGFNEVGEQQFIVLNGGVYFDWFFGTEDEFTTNNRDFGGSSLYEALMRFREHYPDAETLDGVVPQEGDPDSGKPELTQTDIAHIRYYLTEAGDEGGLNQPLVLHRENLDIRILEKGLHLVVFPIHTVVPPSEEVTEEQWMNVCTSYVPLELHANGKAPTLYAGFEHIMDYPENYNPALRIGLKQIEEVAMKDGNGNALRIDLRGATYVGENVDRLGLIDYNSGTDDVDYTKIYLVGTDDPQYEKYFAGDAPDEFNEFMLPIGKLLSLNGVEYTTGSGFDNYAELQFDLGQQTLEDGQKFAFAPREGYYYTFIVHFEEKTGGGLATTNCWGAFPMTMKVVPEYLVWDDKQVGEKGVATGNWHHDGNWRRAGKSDLRKTGGDSYDEYADGDGRAFTPMLFSKVVMPRGAKVELYAAGLSTSGSGQTWVTQRPQHIGEPTNNIQYDLMAYDHKEDGGRLETEPFRVSMADEIHFEPEAEMLHAEYLYYNKAYTDLELEGGQWYTLASPLQEVVAGDFYTKQSGQEDAEYFTGISFDDRENNRFAPSFYQRAWKDATGTVALQTPQQDGVKNVAVAGNWSALYNDVDERYPSGWGFSLKVQDLAEDAGGKVLVRLPKEDDSYLYYSQDGRVSGNKAVIKRNTDAVGKLKSDSLFLRGLTPNYAWQNVEEGTLKVELGTSASGNYYLVGNPFMSHLDVAKFLAANDGILEQKYWYVEKGEQDAAVAAAEGDQGWISVADGVSGTSLVPPMRSFFVKKVENATGHVVKFTADMQTFVAEAAGGDVNANLLRLTATTEDGRESRAVVAWADGASEDYVSGEDAELFLDSNLGDVPSVYTVGGTQALSVNVTPVSKRIPLGVYGTEDEAVALRFEGTDVCNGVELYDVQTQVRTALYDGMEITVRTNEDGRYYILPVGTEIEKEEEAGCGFAVYSVRSGEVVVASPVGSLTSVKVYTAGGMLMAEETCAEGTTSCRLTVKGNENYVVHVTDVNGKKADVKLHVK